VNQLQAEAVIHLVGGVVIGFVFAFTKINVQDAQGQAFDAGIFKTGCEGVLVLNFRNGELIGGGVERAAAKAVSCGAIDLVIGSGQREVADVNAGKDTVNITVRAGVVRCVVVLCAELRAELEIFAAVDGFKIGKLGQLIGVVILGLQAQRLKALVDRADQVYTLIVVQVPEFFRFVGIDAGPISQVSNLKGCVG
jgi:hypothetical protein